ncbi:MAG: hypothetical protein ACRDJN_07100 [Chloroflexota bacterium]
MSAVERAEPRFRADPWAGVVPQQSTGREEEDYILLSPLSEARKQAFRERYLHDREQAATAETLFERAGRFRTSPQWNSAHAFGFSVLLQKGPFVEGSNWLSYSTWEFALAAQRHILSRFEELLRLASGPPPGASDLTPTWHDILGKAEELAGRVGPSDEKALLIVVTGDLDGNLLEAFPHHATPRWGLSDQLDQPWILGAHHNAPVLHIRDAPISAVYAVDLARFATLTKYGTDIEFDVRLFDESEARELLTKNPDLIADPAPGPAAEEERTRQLQLMVGLRLYESFGFEQDDTDAAAGWPIATVTPVTIGTDQQ